MYRPLRELSPVDDIQNATLCLTSVNHYQLGWAEWEAELFDAVPLSYTLTQTAQDFWVPEKVFNT